MPRARTFWDPGATSTPTRRARWAGMSGPPDSDSSFLRTSRSVVEQYLPDDVTNFLAAHGLNIADVPTWVSHPGGPKVIESIVGSLGLPDEALELTWRSLSEVGNLSSASVLHVLRDTIAKRPVAGSPGLMLAMGPGFCSELVMLRWR